eukprot:CAMPEP_0204175132 /NCGR_PEP_ID=MMETSP0361-20130328/46482_1 /ASSEMBLY_ACC=CAM_ASM_000343 /TAXON_ID=268821 /ORGANISM="Scrippsiella Hangoei, Strain SHTV-5" /LENGTH=129 /DNA_ID=CAMNT_0051133729 /DNA_START=155 /DNA_END=542 /DNA_ORIENTATION=+
MTQTAAANLEDTHTGSSGKPAHSSVLPSEGLPRPRNPERNQIVTHAEYAAASIAIQPPPRRATRTMAVTKATLQNVPCKHASAKPMRADCRGVEAPPPAELRQAMIIKARGVPVGMVLTMAANRGLPCR